MRKCVVCEGTEFYTESGFYFCKECQTQNEDLREEVLELRIDATTRLRRIRIRQDKSSTSEQNLGWTTWEQYNFILIGLTNELVELGASLDIKITVLQLWAFYLKNLEVAFTSTTKRSVPKLARKFNRRDAEIIYGKIAQRKKNRRKSAGSGTSASSGISGGLSEGSSNRDISKHKKRFVEAEYERFVQSQDSSEGDALSVTNQSLYSVQSSTGKSSAQTEENIKFNKGARRETAKVRVLSMKLPRLERLKYRRKHVTTQYKIGPHVITAMKLWALIYLALRIHNERIHLADMLRYGREGHLSYYKLDHLLPPEVTLTKTETNLLHHTKEITHKGMRHAVASLAKFLQVLETRNPDFSMLLERYCTELQLPNGVMIYAERLMARAPPKMTFDAKTTYFPNYEGRAMAFIIVVMKVLFGLDGITEYEISRVIEKINSTASTRDVLEARLFSFREWQRYIECRRCVLVNVHFPTKLKLAPDVPGNHRLYLKFIADMKSRSSDREEPEIKSYKHLIPRELVDAMKASIEKLNNIAASEPKEVDIFRASLTPQHTYLQQVLQDPEKDVPANLKMDFHSMKVGYMTDPESLKVLAAQCDMDLNVTDTGVHFIEKVVPPFEQSKLPIIQEFNKTVRVEQSASSKAQDVIVTPETCEDLNEYLHRKNPGSIFIDTLKRTNYDTMQKSSRRRRREFLSEYVDDFGFDEVLPSGKLAVANDSDSDNESVHSVNNGEDSPTNGDDDGELVDFLSKYNVNLSNYEKSCVSGTITASSLKSPRRQVKRNLLRDSASGKFISADPMAKLEKAKNVSSRTRGHRNEVSKLASPNKCENQNAEVIELDVDYDSGLQDNDISILHDSSLNASRGEMSGFHFLAPRSSSKTETLFRPYTEYWMHRCHFSRVKQKNFRQLQNDLPESFRWLLNECAGVVEMSEEDLYEEVCLVESYYADILRPNHCPSTQNQYDGQEYRTKTHYNSVMKNW